MLPQCVLAFLLLATAFYAANAKERALSSSDIAAIRRICRQVVGYSVANEYNLFWQLTPFLRSKSELEHLIVNCSSQHCSGSIHLRDQAEVLYTSYMFRQNGVKSAPALLRQTLNIKAPTGSLAWPSSEMAKLCSPKATCPSGSRISICTVDA
jgi:hypothetical protein